MYLVYVNSSSTIKRRIEKHGIETYCKKDGLIQVRTASQKIGLFNAGGYVIIKPEYRNIVLMPNYYLLENEKGLWGAYNASLAKMVVECKYETIKVDNNHDGTNDGTPPPSAGMLLQQ